MQCNSVCPLCAKSGHCLLFDHLVGTGEHGRRNREALCFRGFEIDYQLVLRRPLHRHVGWHFALQDAIDVDCRSPIHVGEIGSIRDQAATGDEIAVKVDRGNLCRAASETKSSRRVITEALAVAMSPPFGSRAK